MFLEAVKITASLLVFAGGFVGGWLPLRDSVREGSEILLGRANALAAGMFLGIGMVHMLPEAHEVWSQQLPGYPVAFLLASIAFLLVLFFEHVVLSPHHHGSVEGIGHGATELTSEVATHAGRHEFYAYALLVALSVHSLISGIALGAQTRIAGTIVILVALVAHKFSEGLGLGISLVRNRVPRVRAQALLLVFAGATPLGAFLGSAASQGMSTDSAQIFSATCVALASGTFIYIASLDIITEEFTHGGDRGAKWLLAAAGLAFAALLALWV